MKLLINAIEKEQQRIVTMIELYNNQLICLEKGVIVQKKVKNKEYNYLQYRDGKKVITKYIGNDEEKIKEISIQLKRRKHIEAMLCILKKEFKKANKLMEELK